MALLKKMKELIIKRNIDGKPDSNKDLIYAEGSKKGRLNGRFSNTKNPFYLRTLKNLRIY